MMSFIRIVIFSPPSNGNATVQPVRAFSNGTSTPNSKSSPALLNSECLFSRIEKIMSAGRIRSFAVDLLALITNGEAKSIHLSFAVLCFVVLMIVTPAIPQSQSYHDFADKRQFFGIPNTMDVISNFPFLAIGIIGLVQCFRGNYFQLSLQGEIWGWTVFFIGVASVAVGSSYYHLQPNDARLLWDRLPMTIAFASIVAIFVIERIDERKGTLSIIPFLVAGVVSILYWRFFEDLRPYAVVQFLPCLAIPLMAILVPPMYTHSTYWYWAAAFYLLAKIEEAADKLTYELTHHVVSGHTLKHLFAAMVPVFLALMLSKRRVEIQRLEKRRSHNQNQSVKLKHS